MLGRKDSEDIAYLSSFPDTHPNPPTETRDQTLPIDQLTWENFERLCYRLARKEGQIEACFLRGTRGQDQAGIDIYSLQKGESKYTTYQCKHEKEFGPQKIEDAISEFKNGSWFARSSRFVLCTKESLKLTQRQDKIESQRTILSASDITLAVWDLEEISLLLKGHPDLVDDFFGRSWVRIFNGEDAANALKNRLEGKDFAKIRKRFAKFYSLVFQQNDPGIPHQCATSTESSSLHDRYIIPEVIEKKGYNSYNQEVRETTKDEISNSETSENEVSPKIPNNDFLAIRRPVDSWLANQNRCVFLGDPGSGKSSLLRFLALDILSDTPKLANVHERWGSYLPVWIPFAFWTRLVESNPDISSLPSVFKKWLQCWDEDPEFIALFESSLEDSRLIIFVDGLDEWAKDTAANIALQQLQVFINKHSLNCIVTCRTYSYAKHELSLGGWSTTELATFNKNQQELFSFNWFRRYLLYESSGKPTQDISLKAKSLASDFLSEARRVPALHEFLENPLLLGLLLVQKILKLSLPSKKEKVIEALVSLLIEEHPKAREAAAKVTSAEQISSDEFIQMLEYLAFEGIVRYPEGGLPKDKLKELIEFYLKSEEIGFGWDISRARQFSGTLIKEASEKLGVIVEKSPQSVGFYHRTIQEYLASKHMLRLSVAQQKELLLKYSDELTWRQILLFFFSQIQRESDVKEIIEFIESNLLTKPKLINSALVLLANLIYLNNNCPVAVTRKISPEILDKLYSNSDFDTKAGILDASLNGLCTSRSKEIILDQIDNWYPCRTNWRKDLIEQCVFWQPSNELMSFLWRGLFDETPYNQRATARTIAQLEKGKAETANKLKQLFRVDPRSSVRAAVLETLMLGWNDDSEYRNLVSVAMEDSSADVRLVGIVGSLLFNEPKSEDLETLIKLTKYPGGVDHNWKDLAIVTIAKYWGKDNSLKKRCLDSVSRSRYMPDRDVEREDAWYLLLNGFPGDSEIASVIAKELQEEKAPLSLLTRDVWNLLSSHFPKNEIIAPAFEKWAAKMKHNERELSLAAGTAPTENVKLILIDHLKSWVPHWAAGALLEHWPNDSVVISTLESFVSESDKNASLIGHLLPKIIKDKQICRAKLIQLLKDPNTKRTDFILKGLFDIDNDVLSDDIVDIFFSVHKKEVSLIYSAGADFLIRVRPDSAKVRELALQQLARPDGLHGAVAVGYRNDAEFRKNILPLLFPLEAELRFNLVKRLASADIDVTIRKSLLKKYRSESSPSIKTYSSIGYHKCLTESEYDDAIEELCSDLWLVGPTYPQGRQAAFCGLVQLKRADKIKDSISPNKDNPETYFVLPPDQGFDANYTLQEHIVENWIYLQEALGDRFVSIITGGKDKLDSIWNELADFADTSFEISKQIMEYLLKSKTTSDPSLLRFWNRQKPKSESLLECCMLILSEGDARRGWRNSENDYLAAKIIGYDFFERADIGTRIESMLDGKYDNYRALLALSIGWPNSPKLKEAFDYYSTLNMGIDFPTFVYLVSAHSSSKRVSSLVEEVIEGMSGRTQELIELILPALERRIKSDPNVLKLLIERIKSLDNDVDLQVTLIQLCLRFGLDLSSLEEWANGYLAKLKESSLKPAKDLLNEKSIWVEDVISLIIPQMH